MGGVKTEKREASKGAGEKGKNNKVIKREIEGNYVLGERAVCRQTVMICPDEVESIIALSGRGPQGRDGTRPDAASV